MSDVKCPYCKVEQEINHDDGYGYDESKTYEQHCDYCCKPFIFTTAISFDYQVECQEGDHNMEQSPCMPDLYSCENCDFYEVKR